MFARRTLFGLGVIALVAASPARADFKDFIGYCSPGALRSCASLQIITTLNGSGGTNVLIRVQNLQGSMYPDNTGGSLLTRIGIVAPTNIGSASGLTVTTSGTATAMNNPGALWSLRTPGSIGSPIELAAGISSGTSGAIVGCSDPSSGTPSTHFRTCGTTGWVEFSFTTSNAWSANDAELAWVIDKTTNFPGGGLECDTDTVPAPGRTGCIATSPVPEPITMVLMGSGLAGMGGIGFLRRRRKNELGSE